MSTRGCTAAAPFFPLLSCCAVCRAISTFSNSPCFFGFFFWFCFWPLSGSHHCHNTAKFGLWRRPVYLTFFCVAEIAWDLVLLFRCLFVLLLFLSFFRSFVTLFLFFIVGIIADGDLRLWFVCSEGIGKDDVVALRLSFSEVGESFLGSQSERRG